MLYVKYHKNEIKGFESKNVFLKFGVFGIKAIENGELTEKHIILIKKLFTTIFKKSSRLWIRFSTMYPKTARPLGSRMGSGKGPVVQKIAKIKRGQVLLEWNTAYSDLNFIFLRKMFSKLGILCTFVVKGL